MWVPLLSTVARWFAKRRGLASGIAASGMGVGAVIMPPLSNQLISSYSWRTSYLIIGLIVLTMTITIAQFLKRNPRQMGLQSYYTDAEKIENPYFKIQGSSVQNAIRTKQFWIICILFLSGNFCVQTVLVHIVPHATDIGISAIAAATIVSAIGVTSIGGKVGLGSAIDRIGSKRVEIIVFVLVPISFLWLLVANELWMLYLFALVFGVAYGGFSAVMSPILADFFGLRLLGTIFGLAMFASQTGGAIGSLIAGHIYDINKSYFGAFILCVILGILGLILSILLKGARK